MSTKYFTMCKYSGSFNYILTLNGGDFQFLTVTRPLYLTCMGFWHIFYESF
jgi:hypothetical protein